ncbi:phage tail sheath C-terminal domain-containing protein [uncultured Shewanella sp.]|uniref:phage tail sheath family protein n=1 Tax=uncultured Shewanella sp. TaxID=173975 RepID=UPI002637DC7D|nr:phage tail sheath C-terminal domain-containing protein [uncultured Shewanella sp.]
MAQYKTPDVYVKERSLLSPSVAEVPTAIPAFIGYTQLVEDNKGGEIVQKPYRITNMMEFMAIFGGPYSEAISVAYKTATSEFVIPTEHTTGTGTDKKIVNPALANFFLYQAVGHFFANGGGTCYVISIGGYETTDSSGTQITGKSKADFMLAITALKKVDEVTLISCPESICLDAQAHYDVQNASLQHCESMQDRFALIDLQQVGNEGNDDIRADAALMRDKVTQGLKYGAAYYPQLKTSVARSYDEDTVMVNMEHNYYKLHATITGFIAYYDSGAAQAGEAAVANAADGATEEQLKDIYDAAYYEAITTEVVDQFGYSSDDEKFYSAYFIKLNVNVEGGTTPVEKIVNFAGKEVYGLEALYTDKEGEPGNEIDHDNVYGLYRDKNDVNNYLNASGQIIVNTLDAKGELADSVGNGERIAATVNLTIPLSTLNTAGHALSSTAAYNQVKSLLSKHYLQLPPSAAIAGVMAKTDAQFGVWKAPANVALAQVVEPTINIDNGEQEDLNVDINAGKSINAIRSFVGKGTLVWGARTLDGNSNEWRYVPVRRLFNMVEESVKKASYFAVFEPNTPFTWLKIKTTIEGYLETLYKQGAFFGASPDQAFFVNVGLGQTMTEGDINNGIMNIEIGLAAVRPAEFIVLTFSHKSIEG